MAADPRDLTTVALVEGYLTGVTSSDSTDALIQSFVTAASVYVLNRCGRDTLNSVETFNERYDGSGSRRQFLRNSPINAVSSLKIVVGGAAVSVPQSPDAIQAGFVIDQGGKSLVLIGVPLGTWIGSGFSWPGLYSFPLGVQNVLVTYSAGYSAVPPDVQVAATQLAAINYKRRGWLDQKSQSLPQGGNISYRDWEIPPEVERCVHNYTRRALV